MGSLIRMSKKSKGAEKRLYKSVRLMILYKYTAENQCIRRKTKERYMSAHYSMKQMVLRMAMRLCGNFQYWTCEAVGSRKAIDLVADRDLAFLIHLSNHEDMS